MRHLKKSQNNTNPTPIKKGKKFKFSYQEDRFLKAISKMKFDEAIKQSNWSEEEFIDACEVAEFSYTYQKAIGLSDKQIRFLKIYPNKMANVKQTCKAVLIHRSTYYDWVKKSPVFKQEVHEIREGLYDDVESILKQKVLIEKNTTALIFFTKTKMKHRGFIMK